MKNKNKGFKSKKLRYGGYAAVTTLVMIAILVVINLVVSEMQLKVDLTSEKLFSLSDTSKNVLERTEDPIKIYAMIETGTEVPLVMEAVKSYVKESERVLLETVDPILNPGFVEAYKEDADQRIANMSFIVVNERTNRSKIVDPQSLIYNNRYKNSQDLYVEQAITSAIDFVTREELPRIYLLSGHGEDQLPPRLMESLDKQNYQIQPLNLLTEDIEVSKENVVILNTPKKDLAEDEAKKLTEYLGAGGRALIITSFNVPDLPKFASIMKRYGLKRESGIVIEANTANMVQNYANMLIPNMADHDITKNLKSSELYVVVPQAGALSVVPEKKTQVEVTPILETSSKAFLRTNLANNSPSKGAGDIVGTYNVGMAVTETTYNSLDNTNVTTKILAISSPLIMDQSVLESAGNLNFLVNGMNWLSDQEKNISILPKGIVAERVQIDGQKGLIYAGVFIIVLPLMIIGIGISVWLRRRHL